MKSVLTFIAGLAIGAGVTYVIQKNRYEEMMKEEIDDLREHMKGSQCAGPVEKDDEEIDDLREHMKGSQCAGPVEKDDEELDFNEERLRREEEYEQELKNNNYISNDDSEVESYSTPHVVTPEAFATLSGFDVISYNYYDNDIIANDDNEELDEENIQWTLGMSTEEIEEQFGVYEDDAVYIRNVQLKTDFEILRQNENYTRRNGD